MRSVSELAPRLVGLAVAITIGSCESPEAPLAPDAKGDVVSDARDETDLPVALEEQKATLSVEEVVKSTTPSIVSIETERHDGEKLGGTGFAIDEDMVVTNYHVVEGARRVRVEVDEKKAEPRRVLALDEDQDLVVFELKEGRGPEPLPMRATDSVVTGESVVAIGHPIGLQNTVSTGIVSGIREVEDQRFIQTTAPISIGNSGGPLLDHSGRVIGVVTFKAIGAGVENVNFAISADQVSTLLENGQPMRIDRFYDRMKGRLREARNESPPPPFGGVWRLDGVDAHYVVVNDPSSDEVWGRVFALPEQRDRAAGSSRRMTNQQWVSYWRDGRPLVEIGALSLRRYGGDWEGELTYQWQCSRQELVRGAEGSLRSARVSYTCDSEEKVWIHGLKSDRITGKIERKHRPSEGSSGFDEFCKTCGERESARVGDFSWLRIED